MRALTLTVLLTVSAPAIASGNELRLLDTTLKLTSQRMPVPVESGSAPTARWGAGATVASFLAADVALVISVGFGLAAGLASSGGLETSLLVGLVACGTSALLLPPAAVMLVGSAVDMRPSFALTVLGNALGIGAGMFAAVYFDSIFPLLIVPAAFATLFGAVSATPVAGAPPRPPPQREVAPEPEPQLDEDTPEFDDVDDDSAAVYPRRAAIARAEMPMPRAFVVPVIALQF